MKAAWLHDRHCLDQLRNDEHFWIILNWIILSLMIFMLLFLTSSPAY
jgi:hypothetical protein